MAREKTMKVVFTFPNTTQAMKMEHCAKASEASGRLIPVPTQISSGCGMAWSAPVEERAGLERLVEKEKIDAEQIYEMML